MHYPIILIAEILLNDLDRHFYWCYLKYFLILQKLFKIKTYLSIVNIMLKMLQIVQFNRVILPKKNKILVSYYFLTLYI